MDDTFTDTFTDPGVEDPGVSPDPFVDDLDTPPVPDGAGTDDTSTDPGLDGPEISPDPFVDVDDLETPDVPDFATPSACAVTSLTFGHSPASGGAYYLNAQANYSAECSDDESNPTREFIYSLIINDGPDEEMPMMDGDDYLLTSATAAPTPNNFEAGSTFELTAGSSATWAIDSFGAPTALEGTFEANASVSAAVDFGINSDDELEEMTLP